MNVELNIYKFNYFMYSNIYTIESKHIILLLKWIISKKYIVTLSVNNKLLNSTKLRNEH